MRKILLFALLLVLCLRSTSQDSTSRAGTFEGQVHYIHQVLNPNKALISDEEFYRDMPNKGITKATLYIRGNQYRWDYEDKIEIYTPKTHLISIISKRKKDSIYTISASQVEEPTEKIKKTEMQKRILNYDLMAYELHTKWDTRTFFYTPLALKTNPNFWKNHKYNYFADFISQSKSFPMMIHNNSLLGNWIMAASKIEEKKLDDDIFNIEKIWANLHTK